MICCFIDFLTAIAEAIEKWRAEKEARLAGGGGAKEVEEEEEYIYAVKDDEVMVQAEHYTSDTLHCEAANPVCTLQVCHDSYYTGLWPCTVQLFRFQSE